MRTSLIFQESIRAVFPPKCSICGIYLRDGTLCRRCLPSPIEFNNRCDCCFEPCDDGRCYLCLIWPLNCTSIRYLYCYRGKTKSLLRKIKYKNRKRLLLSWLEKIKPLIQRSLTVCDCDVTTWIPTSTPHLFSRGFDVGRLVASTVTAACNLKDPKEMLVRTHDAPAQALLFARQRLRNVRGLFSCSYSVTGKKVLLIDDVMTTGASIAESSHKLYESGASKVEVFCLARSEHWNRYRKLLNYPNAPKALDEYQSSLIASPDETSLR